MVFYQQNALRCLGWPERHGHHDRRALQHNVGERSDSKESFGDLSLVRQAVQSPVVKR